MQSGRFGSAREGVIALLFLWLYTDAAPAVTLFRLRVAVVESQGSFPSSDLPVEFLLWLALEESELSVGPLCRGFTHQATGHGWRHEGLRAANWPMASHAGCQDTTDKLPASLSAPVSGAIDGSTEPRPGSGPSKARRPIANPGSRGLTAILSGGNIVLDLLPAWAMPTGPTRHEQTGIIYRKDAIWEHA